MAPAAPSPPAISLRGAVALSGRFPLLAGVDLEVAEGETVLVEGPNGAGKTSLLRVCAGLVPLASGRLTVLGLDPVRHRTAVRRRVGLLSHASHLYDDLTVRENVRFAVRAAGGDTARIEPACERWGLVGRLAKTPTVKLSAGQRRRVALAVLTARWPEVWLLDEPHAGLDASARRLLDQVVTEASASRVTIVIASHESGSVEGLASRAVTVTGGRVTAERVFRPTSSEATSRPVHSSDGPPPDSPPPDGPPPEGPAPDPVDESLVGSAPAPPPRLAPPPPANPPANPTTSGTRRGPPPRPVRWPMWRDAALVAGKDLRIEGRSRVALTQVAPFGIVALVLFAFALGPDRQVMAQGAPGLFWVAVLFCTVLAVQRSVSVESVDGARDGLRLSGIDPAGLYLGKAVAIAAQLVVLELLLTVGVVLLYGARIEVPWLIVASGVLGTIGLATTGTLYGALSAGLRVRETLLPFLLLPIVAPVLLAGTRIWQAAMSGGTPSDGTQWLRLLVVFDAVYLAIGVILFGPIQETA